MILTFNMTKTQMQQGDVVQLFLANFGTLVVVEEVDLHPDARLMRNVGIFDVVII